jgi:hypothetical protein
MFDFGQRGITWHISVIEYYEYEGACKETGKKEQAVRVQVPLDQVLKGGNKQDGPCVFAMLEAMMQMVHEDLPWIQNLIIVSDNAHCYHHKAVTLGIPLLNKCSKGPKITKFIHPETQDGKGACDSHSAQATRWVDDHHLESRETATQYNTACTADEIAEALCVNGGIKNSGRRTHRCKRYSFNLVDCSNFLFFPTSCATY